MEMCAKLCALFGDWDEDSRCPLEHTARRVERHNRQVWIKDGFPLSRERRTLSFLYPLTVVSNGLDCGAITFTIAGTAPLYV